LRDVQHCCDMHDLLCRLSPSLAGLIVQQATCVANSAAVLDSTDQAQPPACFVSPQMTLQTACGGRHQSGSAYLVDCRTATAESAALLPEMFS
jgi:hypothetical protein